MNAAERVRAALAIAARIADPRDALGIEARESLARATNLSREGIELALGSHLERSVSDADLAKLVASAGEAARVTVVLAANVCIAPLRAIALGLAASNVVRVKPSRRDPVLARILIRELAGRAGGPSIEEVAEIDAAEGAVEGDAVHVYGSDESIAGIARTLRPGVVLSAHGTGFGIALVAASEALDRAASLVARDVVPFDQRGCLSPRVVLVEGDAARARAFAVALDEALAALAASIPRGRLDELEQGEVASYVELMRAAGEVFPRTDHTVGFDPEPRRLWMGPACRTVHVAPVLSADLDVLLAPLARHVAALGGAVDELEIARAARRACPGARPSALGDMQRPPLDGPVDLRTRPAILSGGD